MHPAFPPADLGQKPEESLKRLNLQEAASVPASRGGVVTSWISMRGFSGRISEMCKPKECGQDALAPLKRRLCTFRRSARGFSLLELLVVIAIFAVLSTLMIQVVGGLSLSRGMTSAMDQSTSLFELARNEAITRQSFVWVAIKEAEVDGTLETQMVAFCSADGTTNSAAGNLVMLVKPVKVRGVGLVRFADLKAQTRNLQNSGSTPKEVLSNSSGVVYTNVPATPFTNRNTVTFTPRGEAMLLGQPGLNDGFDPFIAFGIVPAKGTLKLTNADDGAIIVDGSTGAVRKFRM